MDFFIFPKLFFISSGNCHWGAVSNYHIEWLGRGHLSGCLRLPTLMDLNSLFPPSEKNKQNRKLKSDWFISLVKMISLHWSLSADLYIFLLFFSFGNAWYLADYLLWNTGQTLKGIYTKCLIYQRLHYSSSLSLSLFSWTISDLVSA